jgi:hypothetical protein
LIIKRLSRAISGQDWSTVILELFIVIIGIFLGLQVNDWNEERKIQKQEFVYLAKLSDDLTAMRANLLEYIEKKKFRIDRMISALNALQACDDSPGALADIKYTFERYQVSRSIDFLDATYNEMVASGALAGIDNQELKRGITYTFSALGQMNSSVLSFRISMPVVDGIVWKNVAYGVDEEGKLQATFEIHEICENIELRNAVAEMLDIQKDGISVGVAILPMVDDLIALVNEHGPG